MLGSDVPALERYLLEQLPDARGPLRVEQFPGGASNLTYLLRLGDLELSATGARDGPVFVGIGALISHDDVVDDHCFIAPGAVILGNVRVGPYCLLGANSTIRDGLTVAGDCVIGAGVTIRRDTGPAEVYIESHGQPVAKSSDQLRNWLTWRR